MTVREVEMTRLLRIGEFARRTGLSVRTLRFYGALGLLRPAEVDASSGYRLYTEAQVAEAEWLIELRRLGVPLEDVRAMIRGQRDERTLLLAARERLAESIHRQSSQLALVDARLAWTHPSAGVRVRREPGRWVASVRDRLAVTSDVKHLFDELRRGLDTAADGVTGVLWHRCAAEGALTASAFVEVPRATRPRGRVSVSALPESEVATIRTPDDEDAAEQGYRALNAWMARERRALQGPKREVPAPDAPGWLDISFPFETLAAG